MPPAAFIGKSTGTNVGATFSFAVPPRAQPGDTYVAIIGAESGMRTFDLEENPEMSFYEAANGIAGIVHVLRRPVVEGDPPVIVFVGDAPPAWARSVMLVYRQLEDTAAVEISGVQVAASTNFPCPARTLAKYSDLYLGIALVSSAATAVAHPAGTTERHEEQAAARTLEVFELLRNATGTTGVRTATTGANQSGVAASIALSVKPPPDARVIVPDVPGAIGLVEVGV